MTGEDRLVETIAVHDGEMTIPLGDDDRVILTANLRAAKAISRHFGGFQQAMNKVAAGDLEAFIAVMRHGIGDVSEASARRLEERVFRAGVLRLTAPLTEFVLICANGGKPLSDLTESAPGKDDA